MKSLKEISDHYMKTGDFLPEGYEYMFNYLIDNVEDMYDEYISEYTEESPPFGIHVLIRMGDWQVDNGFGKEYKSKNFHKLMKELDDLEDEIIFIEEDDENNDSGLN